MVEDLVSVCQVLCWCGGSHRTSIEPHKPFENFKINYHTSRWLLNSLLKNRKNIWESLPNLSVPSEKYEKHLRILTKFVGSTLWSGRVEYKERWYFFDVFCGAFWPFWWLSWQTTTVFSILGFSGDGLRTVIRTTKIEMSLLHCGNSRIPCGQFPVRYSATPEGLILVAE